MIEPWWLIVAFGGGLLVDWFVSRVEAVAKTRRRSALYRILVETGDMTSRAPRIIEEAIDGYHPRVTREDP